MTSKQKDLWQDPEYKKATLASIKKGYDKGLKQKLIKLSKQSKGGDTTE